MNKVLDKFRGDIIIPLIICEKCENSYELKPGESIEDFEAYKCGGILRYHDSKDNNETL